MLVVESLDPDSAPRRRGVELRPLLNVTSLALLVVLLLSGGYAVARWRSGGDGSARHAVASRGRLAGVTYGQGWNPGGTPAAQDIAFAAGAPATAYDCGAPSLPPTMTPVPIAVASTADGGRTWHALPSPGAGVTCGITVNPTDAEDVVLMISPSSSFATAPIALYRSFDGGRTWARWSLPPRLGPRLGAAEYAVWTWSGSTLFVAPYYPGTTGYLDLAASVAGQSFVWVQQNGLFRGAPSDAGIDQLLGTPDTLYVVLFSQNDCTPACTLVRASHDGGASWSPYAPTFQGRRVNLISQSADGRTLFGSYFQDPAQAAEEYVYSSDGGATWRQLTPFPAPSIASDIFATPDGTDYAVLDTDPEALDGTIEAGVYRLSPGARGWSFIAPPVDNGSGPVVVSWNAAGHPLALWSNIHASIADGIQPGIQRHPA